jgi:outer membrane protein assembly factor BamB
MKYNVVILSAILLCVLPIALSNATDDWTTFRGNGGSSNAGDQAVPVKIGDAENIAWEIDLPGRGPSSPIVLGDRVYVTCSSGDKQDQIAIVCVDKKSGKKVWQRDFWATGRCVCHPLSANAAPTPVTDGKNIYAFFSSNDLVCLDLDGNLKWFRGLTYDYPKAANDTGMSSSPVIADGVVVVQIENQGKSFAAGIDAQTGKTIWNIEREPKASWSSPVIIPSTTMRPTLVVLQSNSKATVHEIKSGKKVWEHEGQFGGIPSPVFANNILYLPIGGTTAFKVSDTGQFEKLWNSPRMAPGTASLVVAGDRLYSLNRGGVANCFDAKTGERKWQVRVGGTFWATPLLAGNNLYFLTQDGKAKVVELSDTSGKIVYEKDFEQTFLGSPAVSDDAMYIRSDKKLYRFSRK